MSPASGISTTPADSSFSTVVKQTTPRKLRVVIRPLNLLFGKGPTAAEPYSMARHHYMPTAMSPVALDRYDRAFSDKGTLGIWSGKSFDRILKSSVLYFKLTELL